MCRIPSAAAAFVRLLGRFRLWLSCITFSEVKHVTERLRRVKFTRLWVHSHLRHALHFVGKLVTHVAYHSVFD